MKADFVGKLEWDLGKLQVAMGLTVDEVKTYFRDGRRASFILERRIARELVDGEIAPSEGAPYDIKTKDGFLWEVRSVTAQGIYFTPSNQVGKGRQFEQAGFDEKLQAISGFLVSDIVEFPRVNIWRISCDEVIAAFGVGLLGKNAKISRAKFLKMIEA